MSRNSSFSSVPEFNYFVDSTISAGKQVPVVIMPLFLQCAPEELPKIASGRKIAARIELITEDVFEFKIGLRKRSAKGYLTNYGEYWCAFLIPNNSDITIPEVASRWMDDMFPIVAPAYINSQQMLELIDGLKVVEKSETLLLDYVTRSAKEGEITKRWRGNEFSREQVMNRARQDNALVDAIRIEFSSPNFKFKIKLNRRGLITLYDGSYSELQRLIISKLITVAQLNLSRTKERKRIMSDGEVKVESMRIKPEIDLTSEDMKQLKESLSEHYMTAVLYGGNPWLMISLLDKSDGSAIDLQAYHDEIIITPVIRVSAESFARLFSVIEEVLPTTTLQIV